MILNLEQVRAIARGVAYVEETDGVFFFHRFTKSQEQAYLDGGNAGFCKRLSSTAGVRLAFVTDSSKFSFRYALKMAGSRPYGAFDVYENGILIKHFGFESGEWTCEGSQSVALSQGTKTVELYLPWSFGAALSEITLDDGAMLEGFSRKYTMISFGDSITQGVDVVHPSLAYAPTLARLMDADSRNKGIGGEVFFPALLEEKEDLDPDFVTVAYGSNDWSKCTYDVLKENARAFYQRVSALYPNARIFGITPVYRLDGKGKGMLGAPCWEVDAVIREVCADLPNVTVITGWNMVPATREFFSDFRVHPNDMGAMVYAQNLYAAIAKELMKSKN